MSRGSIYLYDGSVIIEFNKNNIINKTAIKTRYYEINNEFNIKALLQAGLAVGGMYG